MGYDVNLAFVVLVICFEIFHWQLIKDEYTCSECGRLKLFKCKKCNM